MGFKAGLSRRGKDWYWAQFLSHSLELVDTVKLKENIDM